MADLTDDERRILARCTIGGKPIPEWLATSPGPDRVHSLMIRWMDRGGPRSVPACVLAGHLGADTVRVYAENWPRKAAKLAEAARARGDQPHAERLHAALIALMFCANCGRPLEDPVSIERGIGPDCWGRIDPQWRHAIASRVTGADVLPEAS